MLLFQILLRFLKKVVDHEGNKMTVNSVAMIMAPNLFLVASGKKNKDKEVQFHMATGTATIVRMLIKYQHIQWTVSAEVYFGPSCFTITDVMI